MADDVLRSISTLNLENSPVTTYELESKDIILIKESIAAALCKIAGIDHPLHDLAQENIILTQDDEQVCSYRFKNEAETISVDF